MCRVTMGHLRVTIGHLRVTVGLPRVTMGHLRLTNRLSLSKHNPESKANLYIYILYLYRSVESICYFFAKIFLFTQLFEVSASYIGVIQYIE